MYFLNRFVAQMQGRNKSNSRHPCSTFLSVLLLFTAFLLFLLVSLSLPIIKPIYLFSVRSTTRTANLSLAQELRFGVWGACAVRSVRSSHHLILTPLAPNCRLVRLTVHSINPHFSTTMHHASAPHWTSPFLPASPTSWACRQLCYPL